MYRFVSISLVIMALLLGLGTFVSAQTCPNIGSVTGIVWQGTAERISYCMAYNTTTTPIPPDSSPTFAKRWKQSTTTYYQEPGNCVFTAFRTVTLQSDNGTEWYTPVAEDTWFTGIITDNGTKISMQAQPGPNNPPYIVYANITKVDRKTRMANEMNFNMHSSLGDLGTGLSGQNVYQKCSYTSWGTSTRQ